MISIAGACLVYAASIATLLAAAFALWRAFQVLDEARAEYAAARQAADDAALYAELAEAIRTSRP